MRPSEQGGEAGKEHTSREESAFVVITAKVEKRLDAAIRAMGEAGKEHTSKEESAFVV